MLHLAASTPARGPHPIGATSVCIHVLHLTQDHTTPGCQQSAKMLLREAKACKDDSKGKHSIKAIHAGNVTDLAHGILCYAQHTIGECRLFWGMPAAFRLATCVIATCCNSNVLHWHRSSAT